MSGPLKNPKHERFAQWIAKGKTQIDAYVKAGFKPNDSAAARLCGNVRIHQRVAELQELAAKRAIVTVADIAKQLDQDRRFARTLKHSSAAVSATLGKAKVLGLIKERHEHTGRDGGAIPMTFDLSGLTDEQLQQLETIRLALAQSGVDPGGEGAQGAGSGALPPQ